MPNTDAEPGIPPGKGRWYVLIDRNSDHMDPKLKAFLELVDCRPDEVKDIPLGRPLTTDMLKAECDHIDPQARHQSPGETQVYFGKHKGKKLRDIPRQYLERALGERPTTNSFRRFRRQVSEFLACAVGSASAEQSSRRQGRHYLAR